MNKTIDGRRSNPLRFIPLGLALLALLLMIGFGTAIAAAGGESGSKGWGDLDTFRVMNFVALAAVLYFVLRKPLPQALSARIKGIKDQLEEMEAKKEAAEKKLAEYNRKLTDMEKEAEKIVAEYIRQGEEAKSRIIKEAEAAAARIEEQAGRNIEQEFERAKEQLKEEILETSLVKAEEIIKRQISAEDQNRLVDEYLEKVVAQ
jgi:F-type H+-transporting ATPase subunit b